MNDPAAASTILIIGAGPAGIFAAEAFADKDYQVILLNRDIRPGGLAEYGIYHDKVKIKAALRTQFHRILKKPEITYIGNITVSDDGDLTLNQLREMGFAAIVVAVGAQGTKWLGLPGEQLRRAHHAKDIIYYYNGLPPYSERTFEVGKRVALIGVGNVMADIAHWLVRDLKVDEVIAVARRGPAEVKFTRQELAYVAANLDVPGLETEINRVSDRMRAVGQNPDDARSFILSALPQAEAPVSETRLSFRFLSSPSCILGEEEVTGLEVENTALTLMESGDTKAQRLGTHKILDVDTVIFCIGDRVSEDFGLPVRWFSFTKNPTPCYPVDGISFEAYDPNADNALTGVFIVGWAREASKGQVALARKDARACAAAVDAYLANQPSMLGSRGANEQLENALAQRDKPVVRTEDALRLAAIEATEAELRGDPGFRYTTNEEMFDVLGLIERN